MGWNNITLESFLVAIIRKRCISLFHPTNGPANIPTTSPTALLPAKFTLPTPQYTVDVSDTVSVGDAE